jgi:hypothetical protein
VVALPYTVDPNSNRPGSRRCASPLLAAFRSVIGDHEHGAACVTIRHHRLHCPGLPERQSSRDSFGTPVASGGHDVVAASTGVNRDPRSLRRKNAVERLRVLATPHRFRVRLDVEGFPVIPGRYGRIEWHCDGIDCWSCPLPGQVALAVYCNHPRLFAKLWAIPGLRRHQTGDTEIRAVFPPEALEQVAAVIRAKRRRQLSSDTARRLGAETAYRATSPS